MLFGRDVAGEAWTRGREDYACDSRPPTALRGGLARSRLSRALFYPQGGHLLRHHVYNTLALLDRSLHEKQRRVLSG